MSKGSLFIVLVALAYGVLCEVERKNGIYILSEDNYEEFMEFAKSRNATIYIKFHSPMCQHCQELKPTYIEAAKVLENDPDGVYMFAEVNTLTHETLGKHFQIRSLPTIHVFSPVNDYLPTAYTKARTVFDLVTEMEVAAGLISKELVDYEDFSKRLALRDENVMLGIFKDDQSELYKEMQKAKEGLNFVRMYYSFNVEDFKGKLKLGDGDNFILMFHNKVLIEPGDEAFIPYSPSKYSSLRDFIIEEYPYAVDIMSDKVNQIYNLRRRPAAVLFTPFVNHTTEMRNFALQMKPLAHKFKGKFNMYLEDSESRNAKLHKFEGNATYIIFNIDPEDTKHRYRDQIFNDKIDSNALIAFTQLFLDGKAPKYIRTAEFNKDDLTLPVVTVIGSSYKEVVNDPTKHVFLRYYDKMVQRFTEQHQMRVEWYKVGRYFLNDTRDDLIIAEIETKDNDVPKYFLTEMKEKNHYYFLFMKDNKEKPIAYTGDVSAEKLIKFVEGHIGVKNKSVREDL